MNKLRQAYFGISIKIQLQLSHIILPKIVYDNSGTLILDGIKL